jgi:hypothetical protein
MTASTALVDATSARRSSTSSAMSAAGADETESLPAATGRVTGPELGVPPTDWAISRRARASTSSWTSLQQTKWQAGWSIQLLHLIKAYPRPYSLLAVVAAGGNHPHLNACRNSASALPNSASASPSALPSLSFTTSARARPMKKAWRMFSLSWAIAGKHNEAEEQLRSVVTRDCERLDDTDYLGNSQSCALAWGTTATRGLRTVWWLGFRLLGKGTPVRSDPETLAVTGISPINQEERKQTATE